jgi:hypothetical protein
MAKSLSSNLPKIACWGQIQIRRSLPTTGKSLATDKTLCSASVGFNLKTATCRSESAAIAAVQHPKVNLRKADGREKLAARMLTFGIAS